MDLRSFSLTAMYIYTFCGIYDFLDPRAWILTNFGTFSPIFTIMAFPRAENCPEHRHYKGILHYISFGFFTILQISIKFIIFRLCGYYFIYRNIDWFVMLYSDF